MSAKKKGTVLTLNNSAEEKDFAPLTQVQALPFMMSIEQGLDNNYEFIDMKQKDIKEFHRFVSDTIGKNLSISQVDSLYLRKRGLAKNMTKKVIAGVEREVFHYGRDKQPFRVFGFYKEKHFVVTRIDCKHATNA